MDMLKWMEEKGAKINKLRPYFTDAGTVGIEAAADIQGGELLLFVPKELILTPRRVAESLEADPLGE